MGGGQVGGADKAGANVGTDGSVRGCARIAATSPAPAGEGGAAEGESGALPGISYVFEYKCRAPAAYSL